MRPPAFNAVLFDIDNVLIDTRRSYRDAIRWTVQLYLTDSTIPLFAPPSKRHKLTLLSPADVDQFKLLGGFNDDWDCCYGLLIYLLTRPVKQRTLGSLRKATDIRAFARQVKKRPLRVEGIVKMLGRPPAVTIEKISRIFQEVYLGRDLFETSEKKKPFYWKTRGLIEKEKPIFRKVTLAKLKQRGIALGIATGRPRFEAVYALKRFGLLDFFDCMTTIDEVKKAERETFQSLRKPHPHSILETAKKIGLKKSFLYVGDLPDDILAAREARSAIDIHSVAFPWLAADSRLALAEIQKVNPDFLLKKPSDLYRLAEKGR